MSAVASRSIRQPSSSRKQNSALIVACPPPLPLAFSSEHRSPCLPGSSAGPKITLSLLGSLPGHPLAAASLRKVLADGRFKPAGGRDRRRLSVLHERLQQRSLPRGSKSFVTILPHQGQQTLLLCRRHACDLQGLPAKPGSSLRSLLSPLDAIQVLQRGCRCCAGGRNDARAVLALCPVHVPGHTSVYG